MAGEIVLSETVVCAQAAEYGHSAEIEAYRLIIHASCHILGYDHEADEDYAVMEPIERTIAERVSTFI